MHLSTPQLSCKKSVSTVSIHSILGVSTDLLVRDCHRLGSRCGDGITILI